VLYFTTACAADGDIGQPTGTLQITEDEFNSLNSGKSLQVTNAGKGLYTSYQGPIVNAPPPKLNCWALFNQYVAAHLTQFRNWANANCRPYMSCWTCPDGSISIAFFVNPTLSCNIFAYSTKLAVYEA
jgi:hypothetical protein